MTPASDDTDLTVEPIPGHDWWRQSVVYQVYPRSFADSNGDGEGDLQGIISRVPYLKTLGVDAVWLSPHYPSPLADGGYDVADYRNVDPRFGTLDDFDELVAALHDADMRIVVDIVPNHSSSEHHWFTEALASEPGSAARARYIFREGEGENGELPPSDWRSHFGGSAWQRVPDGQWYLHLFAREQPDFDWRNPEVREDFHTTLRFWSDRGVDGFRIDVAHGLAKDLSEPLRSQTTLDKGLPLDGSDPLYDRDEVHEIFEGWRTVLNEYDPPRSAVAEAWVPAERRVLYARPTELGQAFNFDLLRAPWGAEEFRTTIAKNLVEAETSGASSTWVLSNHDVVRHPTRYGLPSDTDFDVWMMNDGRDPVVDTHIGLRRARAATLLMLALPGSAYLYNGEELGLFEVADLPVDALQDPIWERTEHARKGRDGCRVPLPWNADEHAFGFSDGEPWLPQPEWFGASAADGQDGVDGSTLEFYRTALAARRSLQKGEELEWLETPRRDVLRFARHDGWQVIANFGEDPVELPDGGEILVASSPLDTAASASVSVPGDTTVWLKPE